MSRHRALLLLLALSTVFSSVAASLSQAEQQPIRIGASMAESGNLGTQGLPAANGYRLCQQHVTEKGGLLGRKIEFLIYDDKSDAKLAVSLYEKLITEDKVDAILGPYGSTHTEAVAPVTEKHRWCMSRRSPPPPPFGRKDAATSSCSSRPPSCSSAA